MRLLSPFGMAILAEMQQLVDAKIKKGLKKHIKSTHVACDDLECMNWQDRPVILNRS